MEYVRIICLMPWQVVRMWMLDEKIELGRDSNPGPSMWRVALDDVQMLLGPGSTRAKNWHQMTAKQR